MQSQPSIIEGLLLCGSEYEMQAENVKVNRTAGIKLNQIAQLHSRIAGQASSVSDNSSSSSNNNSSGAITDKVTSSSASLHHALISGRIGTGEFQVNLVTSIL